jgi:hypothetical protein
MKNSAMHPSIPATASARPSLCLDSVQTRRLQSHHISSPIFMGSEPRSRSEPGGSNLQQRQPIWTRGTFARSGVPTSQSTPHGVPRSNVVARSQVNSSQLTRNLRISASSRTSEAHEEVRVRPERTRRPGITYMRSVESRSSSENATTLTEPFARESQDRGEDDRETNVNAILGISSTSMSLTKRTSF